MKCPFFSVLIIIGELFEGSFLSDNAVITAAFAVTVGIPLFPLVSFSNPIIRAPDFETNASFLKANTCN